MPRPGRRAGNRDTRAEILGAAQASFAEVGYDRSTIRGIARRAGVDPALVHHYFGGKPSLFVEVLHLSRDPRAVMEELEHSGPRPDAGSRLLVAFLDLFEPAEGHSPSPFVILMQAMTASPAAADGLREFLMDRVWSRVGLDRDPDERALRQGLVASQLFGVAWDRYLLRLEPFVSASPQQIATWVGPTLDRYMHGPLHGCGPSALAIAGTADDVVPTEFDDSPPAASGL
jgi:AcrR family transcriptional regulator